MSYTTVEIIVLLWITGWVILSLVGVIRSLFFKKSWYNLILWVGIIGFLWPIVLGTQTFLWLKTVWDKADYKDL